MAVISRLPKSGQKKYKWEVYDVTDVYRLDYVWEKYNSVGTTYYTWNKYNVNSSTSYYYSQVNNGYSYLLYTNVHGKTTYSSYNFSSSSGQYSGSGGTTSNKNAWSSSYPYLIYGSTMKQRASPIISSGSYLNNYKVTDWGSTSSSSTSYSRGSTSYGTVNSTSSSAYPSNGQSGGYWYVSSGSYTSYSNGGSLYGSVYSEDGNAYPSDGRNTTDGYWYKQTGTTSTLVSRIQGDTLIGTVSSTDENAYTEGYDATTGLWYVKIS